MEKSTEQKNSPLKKLLGSSSKMAIATLTSRVLGLVRELFMAAIFGATGFTDAFGVAWRIPNILRDLFAESVFSSAFVPIFTEAKQKDPMAARRLFWSMLLLLGAMTSVITILVMIFAPEVVQLFAPKFLEDAEKFEVTVTLLRIMAPFLVTISLAALFMGALNSLKVFFVPSIAPAFFNVVMILSIVFLPQVMKKFGTHEIFAMGIGVVVGGLVQLLIQVPVLLKKSYSPIGPIKFVSSYTKRIINRLGIGTIGSAATQINVLITTILATGTVVGAVSWLNYAFRLFQFPVGILGVSIAGSNLVHFSDSWKKGEHEKAKALLRSSYQLSFILMILAFSLMFALADESVHLVLERGAFDHSDTLVTGGVLRYYLIGLPFYGLYKLWAPVFFALDRPKLPVFISIGSIIFNIIFCVSLTPLYGFKILALGTSLSMVINSFVQSCFMKKLLNLPVTFFLNIRILKVLLAGSLCFLVVQFITNKYFDFSLSFGYKALAFLLATILGTGVYGLVLFLLGEGRRLKKLF